MNWLAFDIETVPDTALGGKLLEMDGISDGDIARAMFFKQMQKTGSDFLPHYQQRVVAISCALRRGDEFRVWTLGEADSEERELIERFYAGIERYQPTLVSWNGSGFDLPVLHYRALLNGVQAGIYWETGDELRDFRYNNYLSRYHWRHIDVMDVLSGFSPRARAGLDAIATMLGFPGKAGMAGDKVWDCFQAGEIDAIRNYCESDVLNTYLVFLRFQFMRGQIDAAGLEAAFEQVRTALRDADGEHLQEFLAAWDAAGAGN